MILKVRMIGVTALILIAMSLNAQQIINKVVGRVGSEMILLSEIEEQYNYIKDNQPDATEGEKCYILQSLLSQKLLVNQAKLDSVVVSDEEVALQINDRIDRILGMMNNDVSQFEAFYNKTVDEVRQQMTRDMKQQMLAERMRGQIMNRAEATPSEVKAFYESIPKDSLPYYNSEVVLQELVIQPEINEAARNAAIEKLNELRTKIIQDSADFSKLARIYSDDPGSARNGGDLGMLKRGTLVPQFEAAAYNLEVNEISPVVESEFGFHIIKLLERRGNNIHTQHILIKPELSNKDLNSAKAYLDSIRQLIANDSLTFEEAVRKYGHEKVQSYNNGGRMLNPKNGTNFFEVGDLEPDVYFATDTLEIDEITAPIEVKQMGQDTYFKIIKLVSRSEPHKASLDKDYAKIQLMATEMKKGQELIEWLNTAMSDTYIELSSEFQFCENLEDWYSHAKIR